MVKVLFDDVPYEVGPGRNLLEAALDHHLELPYFCWHPAMGSVGSCRQCAVKLFKDPDDRTGTIVMACMTPAEDGTRAALRDPEAVAFRRSVIEWLMINHPHDCPVCDEGGECHLQDMTAMTGHVYRRYRGRKRTYPVQNLGPFVTHEMNRCIQCYRCVRFYRDLAGGRDLEVFGSRNRVYFGRYADGALESEFAGNLCEVCPTGVFTDKTLARHYTRKWDLSTAPSICPHCGLGCNTIPGARYGEVRRVQNRYHPEVNGYFLCDRGRYGYEFMTGGARLRRGASLERGPLVRADALAEARERIKKARTVWGIGSGRASLEANYALRRLCGADHFSTGLPAALQAAMDATRSVLQEGPLRTPSLKDVERADAVLVLAADPTGEAPMLDFSLRQSLRRPMLRLADELRIPRWNDYAVRIAGQGLRGVLDVATVAPIKLEEVAREVVHASPPDLVALAAALAERVRAGAGSPGDGPEARMAAALLEAEQPLVVVSAAAGEAMVRAAADLATAVGAAGRDCWLSVLLPECNTMGLALLGGRSSTEILEAVARGGAGTLVVLEHDLHRWNDHELVGRALARLEDLIVIDCVETETTRAADLTLAAAPCAESSGTFVSSEGRAQRFFQVLVPAGEQVKSWALVAELMRVRNPAAAPWRTFEDVMRELGREIPGLAAAAEAAPAADFRIAGMKIAREPHRMSGRAAVHADRTVFEPRPPTDPGTPFTFSMDGFQGVPPGPLVPRFWAPGWNSQQAVTYYQEEVNGPLVGGNPGRRLLEPRGGALPPFTAPPRTPLGEGEVLLWPVVRTFGSEELSRLAAAVRAAAPPATLGLNPADAAVFGLVEGEDVEFPAAGRLRRLPLRFEAALPRGVATVPAGYAETLGIAVPARATLRRAG